MQHTRNIFLILAALALAPRPASAQAVASLSPAPRMQFFDAYGKPLNGGCIMTYQAGSTTPLATYKNAAGTPNQNPVILDSVGRADIWLGAGQAYRFEVRAKTTNCAVPGAVIYSTDYVMDNGFALARELATGTLAIGLTTTPATGAGGGLGSGNALLSATTGGLYVSVNGAAPVLLNGGGGGGGGSVGGPINSVQYNTGSGLGGTTNLTWNNSGNVLTVCAPPSTGCTNTSGIQSPAFAAEATGTNPAFVAGGGAGIIYGSGDAQFQTVKATSAFNSLADQKPNPATVSAFQTSGGDFQIMGDGSGWFQSLCVAGNVQAQACNYGLTGAGVLTVASCTGCGGGAGSAGGPANSIQYNSAGALGGSTNLLWNNSAFEMTVCPAPGTGCTNTSGFQAPSFSSSATGANPAFVVNNGAAEIFGSGDAQFQTVTANTVFKSVSTGVAAAFTQQTQTFQINGDGKAFFQYVCSKGNPNSESCTYGLDPNGVLTVSSCVGCGGGGAGTAAGPAGSIQFNTGTGFGGSANAIWNNSSDVMTICPAPATGCTNSSGVQAPVFASFAAGANPALTQQSGNFQINGDGNAYFHYVCASGNPNSETCTYGLTGAGVLTVASCTGCGGVSTWNTRTGAVTLTKADVTAVDQALGTGDSPQFAAISIGGLYGITGGGALTVSSCSGCSAGVTTWNTRTGAVTLTKADVTAVDQALGTTDTPTFAGVIANGTFNSTATGATSAVQQQSGTFTITGAGNASFQTVSAATFNSTATGATAAFQQSGGTFSIHGDGQAFFQSLCVQGTPPSESCTYGWNSAGDMWVRNLNAASVNAAGLTANASGATIINNGINYGIHEQDTGGSCNIGTGYAGGIGCASDARLKENIRDLPDALAGVLKLKPVTFDWKKNHTPGLGFIAQDVEKVFPGVVRKETDGYLSLSYPGLIPELVKAIQQLTARVAALEARK